ncbi:protein AF-9-like domain containing protein [Babesia gibsoni]|uniref:Protein AF-9-like domain containing protein n=1 Tax=Babesia gibsoni TaxID=33632 RepID=A0AAD8UTT6_BABGI|nr:protein AF-9-like domain containing protein [Babesia gibsoni]
MSTKNNKRVNVKVGKQIAIGTYAFPLTPLEKKRYGSMTHRWTCLLRSPTNENMTHYIKKVQFDLDPSFLNPKRVLTTMPYEVTEVGWGEFYIGVKLFFVDETLEPVQLQHLLVLNPNENTGQNPTTAANETFDEIIFNEPSAWFYSNLMCSTTDKVAPHKYQEYFWDYNAKDKETTCRYICCQSYFQNETYRLLAEAFELSRQIQYLQEKANILKNTNILAKSNGSSAAAISSSSSSQAHGGSNAEESSKDQVADPSASSSSAGCAPEKQVADAPSAKSEKSSSPRNAESKAPPDDADKKENQKS